MSGTNKAYDTGYERGLKGLPDDNPFPQFFCPGNNFDKYRQGYAAGRAAYSGRVTSEWRVPPPVEKPYPSGMSKDRVVFTLREYYFVTRKLRDALSKAFGMTEADFSNAQRVMRDTAVGHITIACRPSQFARFLIYRSESGSQNQFKELKAQLRHPNELGEWDVDVSKNKPY
jgi:hypothetical protein